MSDHHEIFTQFFLDPEVIYSPQTMFINAFTKEFTHVNNAIPSYDIAFKQLLYYKGLPMLTKILTIFLKMRRHIPFSFVNRFLSC